jgi:hypothetical protein
MANAKSIAAYFLPLAGALFSSPIAVAAGFTPAHSIPLEIVASAPAYARGGYEAARLIDGDAGTEYASESGGTNTFVNFRFHSPQTVIAFRHLDRADRALIARSELVFKDAAGATVDRLEVTQADRKAGDTFFVLPKPVLASGVEWRVTQLGNNGVETVGGAEIQFFSAGAMEENPSADTISSRALPFLNQKGNQPIQVSVEHPYLEPVKATLRVADAKPMEIRLVHGRNVFTADVPGVNRNLTRTAELQLSPALTKEANFEQNRVRPMTVYILPHSHTDIGYTELQTAVAEKQVNNLRRGIELARRTADYPAGARFVWNVEVVWAADLFLQRMNAGEREEFFQSVKNGQVELNGMYVNELSGLCRPEELIQLFRYATELSQNTGKKIESAMISDVPGFTWGGVSAMAQAGIRYLSDGPNYGEHRFMAAWADKPFYWIGPDGKSKVLVWIPFQGYALEHIYDAMTPRLVDDVCTRLQKPAYPYDLAYIRWAGLGDNGAPDESICDFVKDWNDAYQSPKFKIAGTTEAFQALEQRYGSSLPEYRGDWTPYWENGAGSSARETAMNRQTAERLTQAQTLFAMFHPNAYPKKDFAVAWKNVLLFSEHTWGSQGSINEPEHPQTTGQWALKKAYAEDADKQSRALLDLALNGAPTNAASRTGVEVINTLSWKRTQLVTVSRELSAAGDRVVDEWRETVPSQRLRSGELAFLAENIPAFASRRYRIEPGKPGALPEAAQANNNGLENGLIQLRVDETSGGIVDLRARGIDQNFAGSGNGEQLNGFIYLRGNAPEQVQTNGPVRISVGETGPLVASLIIDSEAPGCRHLQRELRLISGQDYVEIFNRVDKERLQAVNYQAMEAKECLDFGFPFQVPDADVLLDIPLAAMRPGADQIPLSCQDWFTIGRWVNVANANAGLTWVTLDAPLLQFDDPRAGMRDRKSHSITFKRGLHRVYSWVMNNRWGTNYRAYQDGLAEFRYVLRPFNKSDSAEATRFATGFDQPLIVSRPQEKKSASNPTLPQIDSKSVVVSAAKPSDDGRALIVRLFGASGKAEKISLHWPGRHPAHLFLSNTSEEPLSKISDELTIAGYELVTLRAEFE